jgi:DNA-binding XRE family transcriptional regulator
VAAAWKRIDEAPVLEPGEIRRQREELGARQQDLAAFAGIHRDTVSRVERGNACDPLTLKLLSVALEEMRASRT